MDRQICVGCHASPPDMGKTTTLASPREGWRLTRFRQSDGTDSVAWRCPACWKKYKAERASPSAMPVAPKAAPAAPKAAAAAKAPPAMRKAPSLAPKAARKSH